MKLSGTGPAHRLDECEISVQEQRFSGGVQGPAKPAVVGFTADKPASGSRPFECDLFDLLSNAPYWRQRRGAADVPNYYSKFRLFRQMFFARAGRAPACRQGAGNGGQRSAARAFSRSAART